MIDWDHDKSALWIDVVSSRAQVVEINFLKRNDNYVMTQILEIWRYGTQGHLWRGSRGKRYVQLDEEEGTRSNRLGVRLYRTIWTPQDPLQFPRQDDILHSFPTGIAVVWAITATSSVQKEVALQYETKKMLGICKVRW